MGIAVGLLALAMTLAVSVLAGCGSSEVTPDYPDAASFEQDLNAGEDLTGKTVTFTVKKFAPDSAFGYNLQTGEHLNFVSSSHPGVDVGDTVTVEVTQIESFMGSWIITYEML